MTDFMDHQPSVSAADLDDSGNEWLARLSALSDRSRVRIMFVLSHEELGVGEISRTLGMPQSTVSRHLKPLFELGFIAKRSEGTTSLYRMDLRDDADTTLWSEISSRVSNAEDVRDDLIRLRQVLLERTSDSRSFFGRVGSEWQAIRRELFGFGFTEEALLGLLPTDWVVADLGCGSGDAAERLAPVVSRVLAVDREPAMLAAAENRLSDHKNVEFIEAELDRLPFDERSLDAAIMMLVLHHQQDPQSNVREVARVLKDGGYLVIVDMVSHDRLDLVEAMQHHHLGFEEATISGWADYSGLVIRSIRRLHASLNGRGPALFACIMQKPASG